jgi:hypothetical protein
MTDIYAICISIVNFVSIFILYIYYTPRIKFEIIEFTIVGIFLS